MTLTCSGRPHAARGVLLCELLPLQWASLLHPTIVCSVRQETIDMCVVKNKARENAVTGTPSVHAL